MTVKASKCQNCGKVIVPPRRTCLYCGDKTGEMTGMSLDSQGSILSYTILEMPPDGFDPPLILALVELQQDVVALCLGEEVDIESIGIGSPVRVKRLKDGRLSFRLTD